MHRCICLCIFYHTHLVFMFVDNKRYCKNDFIYFSLAVNHILIVNNKG